MKMILVKVLKQFNQWAINEDDTSESFETA